MSSRRESTDTVFDEPTKHYSTVTKLVHYTSKFAVNEDGRQSAFRSPSRNQSISRLERRTSTIEIPDRNVDNRKSRLLSLWPEWNETDVNAESWEIGSGKKKDTAATKARTDAKSASSIGTHGFEDPEGKVELPPSLKVEQWKRPVDFLPSDRPPVIVDPELGMQNFDLVTPNEHLHYSETMRNIISQITALWDICRRERKNTSSTPENITEPNPAVMSGRTWRPWEHIYALNKVSRQPFVTPYNPAGKYVVRLFFLGSWRKIVIDDTIPFDAKNHCLLPQTSIYYELWPMLLSKALLKVLALDFRSPSPFPEYNEASVTHALTGWLPEPIPLKYTHAKKVWEFLRYDRSNKIVVENDAATSKSDQTPSSPTTSFGPVPLYKWPETKSDSSEESKLFDANDPSAHQDDSGTETATKKSDDKNTKKGGAATGSTVGKEGAAKSATGKESRPGGGTNPGGTKDTRRLGGAGRGTTIEDPSALTDDQTIPEAPKMVVFATIPHLQPTRFSSYSETADRSERLRRYNLNDIFSTSMLLTSVRDIPLEPPPPPEYIPSWKLIRPRKPKVLPSAEPVVPQEPKPERWIEIASPYINYPTPSALHIKPTIRYDPITSSTMNTTTPIHGTQSRLSHSAAHSTVADVHEIVEVDEEADAELEESKHDTDNEHLRNDSSANLIKKDESTTPNKELNVLDTPEMIDESVRSAGSKLKREKSADKNKSLRKLGGSKLDLTAGKISSDAVSVKSKGGESEQVLTPMETQGPTHNLEHQDSQPKLNEAQSSPNITQQAKRNYITPKIWMDFDDFCACFTSVVVYHNPRGYQYTHKHTEVKFFAPQQPVLLPSVAKEKKKEANAPVAQQLTNLQDDKSPLYLFVDSTRETMDKNIELIVSLTSLSRWYETGTNDGGGSISSSMGAIAEKGGRGVGASIDKTTSEVSPARGAGTRQRTSTFETASQIPGPNTNLPDGNTGESQKDLSSQTGSLIAEIYSWKSLSMGQPILRVHTTATKAALLTLPPGRHVLKFTVTCPLASHLQIMSDTNDFTFGDEDQLLGKVISVPEDAEFIARAEELFNAFDDTIQNFNNFDQQDNKLTELFRLYCEYAPQSSNLTVHTCWNAFKDAIYSTMRTICNASGQPLTADAQFAWRCFTNDLITPDIMGAYEAKRPSTSGGSRSSARIGNAPGGSGAGAATTSGAGAGKKGAGGKDKSSDDKSSSKQQSQAANASSMGELPEEPLPDWLNRELSPNEIESIINVQKVARGFLQRRILIARTPGTEKNLAAQRALQATMTTLKTDASKTASLLFRNFVVSKPQLIQCFQFRNDDWNMVTYKDYLGQYQEQPANTWFTLFREIFYIIEDGLISAKLLAHAQNSLLRVINNDTYEEMPLVFNRLTPAIYTKNKLGYTFFAEGLSFDQLLPSGRFRLRLLTSYTHLPEPRYDQITASFLTKEIKDYYIPNKQQIICRYRVIVGDDANQTGRNFHLASIQFSTSKPDVLMRLTILNNNDEVTSVEGKGSVVLPAFLFMRDVINTANNTTQPPPPPPTTTTSQSPTRPTSKTGGGKKDGSKTGAGNTHRGSLVDSTALGSGRSDKDKSGSGKRSRSSSRTGIVVDEEEKVHKYVIQVTLLRKSWPLTPTQWQFVEQLREQEKNELKIFNRQPTPTKADGTGGAGGGGGAGGKRSGQTSATTSAAPAKGKGTTSGGGTGKGGSTTSGRPGTAKGSSDKNIDPSKPHWILRVVSDADKADEITVKKDTERNEELINMKKAWETYEAGRAQKAMKARQKFLDSLQPKPEERPSSGTTDSTLKRSESRTDGETSSIAGASAAAAAATTEQQQTTKQPPPAAASPTKKGPSTTATKKGAAKDDAAKQAELAAAQELAAPPVDEPLLDQPPPSKPKVILPPIDIKPFIKHKMLSDEPVILDPLFEQEELRRRQLEFLEYAKYAQEMRHEREEDHHNRYKEKIRQLEEYVDLQAKIDQSRRTINEPREAFRQRFLDVERKRLAELAAQEQELIAAAEKAKAAAAPTKGKGSAGKKGKK